MAFPAKPAHTGGVGVFEQRDNVGPPTDTRSTGFQSQEVGIGNGLHKAIPQHANRESVGHDVGHGWQIFSAPRVDPGDLKQGAAELLKFDEAFFLVFHSEANHGLAAVPADRIVVAVGARLFVENRPQTILGNQRGVVELGSCLKAGAVGGIKTRNGVTHAGLKLHLADDHCQHESAHQCSMSSVLSIRWKSRLVPSH